LRHPLLVFGKSFDDTIDSAVARFFSRHAATADMNCARNKMIPFLRSKLTPVLFLAACLAGSPRFSFGQILQAPASTPSTSTSTPADPLGRTTPSGTVLGFLQAAQSGDYSIAAQYLQLSPARRQSEGDQIATKLKVVMDRAFAGDLKHVSTRPEGIPQEGVALDHQNLGPMASGDVEANLDLIRVSDPNAGKIWLIAADTLAAVPELYNQVQARQVENRLPDVLVKHQFVGMPLWQWLALLVAIPIAAGLARLILTLLKFSLSWWARRRSRPELNWHSVSGPAWLLIGTLSHQFMAGYLGMPLLQRHYYFQITSVALIIAATWILWGVIQWSLNRVRMRALARGHSGTGSLMLLGERILKAVVFVAGVLAVFSSLGFNMSTALAGLGIGGLAIGFGAQKTIENLFGGVSVLGDEVIRVGDVCRFGDRTGTVEDIGLRSTRVRTEERTLLAIPNGTVATINVENLSRRDKILFKTTLALRPETKPDHMRYVLAELRKLLYSHPKVEPATVRVRLTDIASNSLNVELVSYIMTQDFNEFAAVREDLLLRMMDIVDNAGTGLALPSQTLYLGRDRGLDEEKADNAVKKIAELRDSKQLPFPNFHEKDISNFKGSIEYPQPESAVRKDRD
jgi:MscS family membrane protein